MMPQPNARPAPIVAKPPGPPRPMAPPGTVAWPRACTPLPPVPRLRIEGGAPLPAPPAAAAAAVAAPRPVLASSALRAAILLARPPIEFPTASIDPAAEAIAL